jgi:hypothetical protein
MSDFITMAKGITEVAGKLSALIREILNRRAEERAKIAALLDQIAALLSEIEQKCSTENPIALCSELQAYGEKLKPLLQKVYDEETAEELTSEFRSVTNAKQIAFDQNDPVKVKALVSSFQAAAGMVKATANILRAM